MEAKGAENINYEGDVFAHADKYCSKKSNDSCTQKRAKKQFYKLCYILLRISNDLVWLIRGVDMSAIINTLNQQ